MSGAPTFILAKLTTAKRNAAEAYSGVITPVDHALVEIA
jgi:hypothetical protein